MKNLPLEEVLFPEVLKTAGYTNAFFGKWHLNNRAGEGTYWPQEQGFDINVAGHFRGGSTQETQSTGPGELQRATDTNSELTTHQVVGQHIKIVQP